MSKITKKIKKLESIKLSKEWKQEKKELLLSQIKAQKHEDYFKHSQLQTSRQFFGVFFSQKFMKPTVAFVLMIFLILSGGVATVSASQNSLPGDVLYYVKIATEKARISLLLNEGKKASLEMEFVGRRVEELDQIIMNNIDESEKVQIAVNGLRDDIDRVKKRLNSLQNQDIVRPKEVVEIAKIVDDRTNEYQDSLSKIKNILPKEVKKEVEETLDSISETGEKALEVIIDNHNDVEVDISKEEVIDRVQKKMDMAQQKIVELEEEIESVENTENIELVSDEVMIDEEVADADNGESFSNEANADEEEDVVEDVVEEAVEDVIEEEVEDLSGEVIEYEESVSDEAMADEESIEELNLENIIEKPQEASKILNEAKDFLEQGNVLAAFEKIQESTKITKDVKNLVIEGVSSEVVNMNIEIEAVEAEEDGESALGEVIVDKEEVLVEESDNGESVSVEVAADKEDK